MWRAATWQEKGERRRGGTLNAYRERGASTVMSHEWDWRVEYGTEIDIEKITDGSRVTLSQKYAVSGSRSAKTVLSG